MKKLAYILTLASFLFVAKQARSQDRESMFNMYYSMGLGTGDQSDYISKFSWRGVGLEWKREVTDNVMMGLCFDWNVFYEEIDKGTYTRENVSLTGDQFRYSNMFPMMVKFHYFKDNAAGLRIFTGLGVGTTYQIHDLDMSIYRFNTDTWQFLLAPEIGVTYDLNAANSIFVSTKYNLNFKNDDLSSRSYLNFNVGFSWR